MTESRLPGLGVAVMPQYAPDEFVRFCSRIDALPFERLWIPDERFFRDVGVGLTLAAVNTRRVLIGPAVTDPYIRHPASTATLMATLDELSGGRVTLGIGAGVSGFRAMGVKQDRPALAMREAIHLMRMLWAYDGNVDFDGKTTSFEGATLDFAPLRRRIPIWVAGRGPQVLQLAGEVADGVMIGALASESAIRYAETHISRGLAKSGRDPGSLTRSVWLHTAVADDPARARDAVRQIVVGALISSINILDDLGIPLPEGLVASLKNVAYGVNNPEMQRLAASIDDDVLRHFSVAGTPAEVGSRMRELGAAGIDHLAILPWLAEGQSFDDFLSKLSRGYRHVSAPGLTSEMRAFLHEPRFGVLATLNPDGSAQQTVMWYELRGAEILINTARGRRKARNLTNDPRVSLCIPDGYRFVTLAGRIVRLVDDQSTARADIHRLGIRYDGQASADRQMRETWSLQQRLTVFMRIEQVLSAGF